MFIRLKKRINNNLNKSTHIFTQHFKRFPEICRIHAEQGKYITGQRANSIKIIKGLIICIYYCNKNDTLKVCKQPRTYEIL